MTSESSSHTANPCYTDYALQEYALGRLSEPVRIALSAHVQQCTACAAVLDETGREIVYFQQLGEAAREENDPVCFDPADLARFIDGGGDPEQRERLETHLAVCPKCRGELIGLYRGIQGINAEMELDPRSEAPVSSDVPQGIILTMPKREQLNTGEKLPVFRFRGTGTAE